MSPKNLLDVMSLLQQPLVSQTGTFHQGASYTG
jgi:hypothetical protein